MTYIKRLSVKLDDLIFISETNFDKKNTYKNTINTF